MNNSKIAKEVHESIESTRRLLAELAARQHPAAIPLRKAWLIDLFLRGHISAIDAATIGGVSEAEFQNWLGMRHLSHLLDSPGQESQDALLLSVVVPVFNEESNIPELYDRLKKVLGSLGEHEIIFVDDGSSDRSADIIGRLRAEDRSVKLLTLSRNFGHQSALTAGIDYCRGKAVILLDADLQDPPEALPDMVAKWKQGFEVVYCVRQKRKENFLKRAAYFSFYRILQILADMNIPLDSGDFCLMDSAVVEHLRRLPERNRFLRGLRSWVGFRQTAHYYERQARYAGAPKYTVGKLIRLAFDGVFSFSSFPLRLAGWLGLFTSVGGVLYLLFAIVAYFVMGSIPQGWTSTVALILLTSGAQLLLLGVLGGYVARVYDESKRRPCYVVSEFLD
jgi:dolichol-phosphate mannosyltransferase